MSVRINEVSGFANVGVSAYVYQQTVLQSIYGIKVRLLFNIHLSLVLPVYTQNINNITL